MKKMFKLNRWLLAALLVASAGSLQSCLDDDNGYPYELLIPKAVVTVKPTAADAFYMQLDDETTLKPVNVTASPFGEKEVRALVNYDVVDDPASPYDQAVYINWIDSLLTKPMAPNLGEEENNAKYGDDAVDILADWVTIVEDGYLTLPTTPTTPTKWSSATMPTTTRATSTKWAWWPSGWPTCPTPRARR